MSRAVALINNPGTARFKPIAKAGPESGFKAVEPGEERHSRGRGRGERLRRPLGVQHTILLMSPGRQAPGGHDRDVWRQRRARRRPIRSSPRRRRTGRMTFTLAVTGKGGIPPATSTFSTSTVSVACGYTSPMPESATVDGETLTLTYGERPPGRDNCPGPEPRARARSISRW